ncbi:hypothetical protein [Methylopila sp. 73B]|uniref:hypothetical protein n=1 Tax=Methylopila sp. 73B TaxID=1120792 RepID=UPI0005637E29|nr:hypothetical protein [Methylopila sp. 73B]
MRAVVSAPVAAAVLTYRALDRLLGPLVRPILRGLGELAFLQRLGWAIADAPPYVVLALLAVPFLLIEPLKALSLYWMAVGHPWEGGAALAVCHLLSILTSERVLHLGKPKLMTIPWFATGYVFVADVRDRALAWLHATAAWRLGLAAADRAKAVARRWFGA